MNGVGKYAAGVFIGMAIAPPDMSAREAFLLWLAGLVIFVFSELATRPTADARQETQG